MAKVAPIASSVNAGSFATILPLTSVGERPQTRLVFPVPFPEARNSPASLVEVGNTNAGTRCFIEARRRMVESPGLVFGRRARPISGRVLRASAALVPLSLPFGAPRPSSGRGLRHVAEPTSGDPAAAHCRSGFAARHRDTPSGMRPFLRRKRVVRFGEMERELNSAIRTRYEVHPKST